MIDGVVFCVRVKEEVGVALTSSCLCQSRGVEEDSATLSLSSDSHGLAHSLNGFSIDGDDGTLPDTVVVWPGAAAMNSNEASVGESNNFPENGGEDYVGFDGAMIANSKPKAVTDEEIIPQVVTNLGTESEGNDVTVGPKENSVQLSGILTTLPTGQVEGNGPSGLMPSGSGLQLVEEIPNPTNLISVPFTGVTNSMVSPAMTSRPTLAQFRPQQAVEGRDTPSPVPIRNQFNVLRRRVCATTSAPSPSGAQSRGPLSSPSSSVPGPLPCGFLDPWCSQGSEAHLGHGSGDWDFI